ncbi:MAG: class I SAM-dependent methyltransferase [Acidimicrobiales bacterium]|nr:class I SAM-dependent methyltransferase [Acidimicrobiales bacterium]
MAPVSARSGRGCGGAARPCHHRPVPSRVRPDRKREVPSDFDRVANRYDLLTSKNPGYLDHLRLSAGRLGLPRPGGGLRLLDLCCGTGLSTRALTDAYPDAEVVGLDASPGMVAEARAKDWPERVSFVVGDAMDPATAGVAGPFDGVLMAYGIRNVPDPDRCLGTVLGLLRPGAPACFHEYSVADSAQARAVWTAVAWLIIIPGGLVTSRHTRLYRYLWRSVLEWDGVRAFERRLTAAGFAGVRTEEVGGWQRGIVHSFLARRPAPQAAS